MIKLVHDEDCLDRKIGDLCSCVKKRLNEMQKENMELSERLKATYWEALAWIRFAKNVPALSDDHIKQFDHAVQRRIDEEKRGHA